MNTRAAFLFNLLRRDCEFSGGALPFTGWNKPTRLFEQDAHLFERDALGLRQERPEEDCIGKIADDEQEEIPPTLCLDSLVMSVHTSCFNQLTRKLTGRSDLTNHGVKGETHEAANSYPVGSCFGVEDLRRYDPGE